MTKMLLPKEDSMYRLTSRLIVYSNIGEDSILYCLADICRRLDEGQESSESLRRAVLDQIHRLLDLATLYGFDQNLWHNYLAYLLATTETPFTLVSEKNGAQDGSVNLFARNDLDIFRRLFHYDFSPLEQALDLDCFSVIENFHAMEKKEQIYNRSVSEKVRELSGRIASAEDAEAVFTAVTSFYERYGVGKLGLNKAFRVNDEDKGELLIPITNTAEISLDDLVGYELQKQKLIENTEAFIAGRAANNVLLYGDAGTGKSTSIKGILNRYYPSGLRMIEVYKHQFKELSRIIGEVRNRNYRFIIYMDDLSFEDTELEYKYLKAVIEGGLEPKPENVLIYATSNRRHLVKESFKDRADEDQDLHRNDTVQEKLSLANRFGVQIGYFKPSPKEFREIVSVLASRYPEITISEQQLQLEANRWELSHGGMTGRCAQQFIDHLVGVSSIRNQVK